MTTTKFNVHPSGYAVCNRCGLPWTDEQTRPTIWYTPNDGISPLCQECWDETDVHERVAYAAIIFGIWCGQAILQDTPGPRWPFEFIEAAIFRASGVFTVDIELQAELPKATTRMLSSASEPVIR